MARSARRTLLTRLASPLWGRPGPRGLRGRLLTRYLRGNPRRWTSYLLAGAVWRVARRIALYAQAGHQVVVVVSAMGDTTDELIDLAEQVTPNPPPRELDMLDRKSTRLNSSH